VKLTHRGSRTRAAAARVLAASVAVLLASSAAPARAQQAALEWGPGPPSLPPGARMALVSGDPRKPGPFTIQLDLPDGFTVAPHFHATDEHQTVLRGEIGHGLGDTVNVGAIHWLHAGESGVLPANVHHYAVARGRTIVIVRSTGPFVATYVRPEDDPRQVKQ
jgi:quercetin dioxygenase-like cupin family protein